MKKKSIDKARCFYLVFWVILTILNCFMAGDSLKAQENSRVFTIGLAVFRDNPDYYNARTSFVSVLEEQKDIKFRFKTLDANGDPNVYVRGLEKFIQEDKVDLIFTAGTRSTQPAVETTQDIPIVFSSVAAPVESGLVESLENPGRNVTGITCDIPASAQIATIIEALPYVKVLGIIYTQGEMNAEIQMKNFKEEAEKMGFKVLTSTIPYNCKTEGEVAEAARKLIGQVDLLVTLQDTSVARYNKDMFKLAVEYRIPVYASLTQLVPEGALFSLGINFKNQGTVAATQAIKILKDKVLPKNIPVATDRNYSFTINLSTANKIGVNFPLKVLKTADTIYR